MLMVVKDASTRYVVAVAVDEFYIGVEDNEETVKESRE